MQLRSVSLDDKYAQSEGRIHITGSQALVRLAMMQSIRDRAAGLNTACYISGYRGSPMHNIDKELWRAAKFLEKPQIHFWPAVNEDLAATAIWGSQQANAMGEATVDGVYGMWYGKGPGLDRSMDAIRHGHMAGSSKHGGVLVVVGDDHALTSTDAPAAHEYAFVEMMMPLLYPAGVQDIIEYGLYGWAMSRFCGSWVGFKAIPDSVDASISLLADPNAIDIRTPQDFILPPDGLNLRIPDFWHQQEPRHRDYKLQAALAFARINKLNRAIVSSPKPRYGIIASGKACNDVLQALADMGITNQVAADIGLTVLKIAMPYPFDTETVREFAQGLEEIFVVEEKHRMMETFVRDALYSMPDSGRPRVIGQQAEDGTILLPQWPELNPEHITAALSGRIKHFYQTEQIASRLDFIAAVEKQKTRRQALSVVRQPYFCSGCPHSSSTRVPEGSRAHGGVGCHFMATYMDRKNVTHSHMGGEGLTWVGQSNFVKTQHVFQNIGDGTYFHSGLLAIRGCVSAKVNITFKVLFNDAVAMTGGQPVDGELTPDIITRQVHAEGVRKIYVVSDEPEKYSADIQFAPGTEVRHRKLLDQVQRQCREHPGVSVLVYDQTCAAEKRRRRKSGTLIDPDKRVFINERVCEGCGDCGAKSNCMSVTPVDTPFGRKRQIDQSACNKDYSCVEGFCPSFVSVLGGKLKKSAASVQTPSHLVALPEPIRPSLENGNVYSILVAGVGGTGVVTIGALLTMAAHLEGQQFSTVDQFGMAQKGGAVTSHIRLAGNEEDIHAVRLNAGAADLIIGCDSLVTGNDIALNTMHHGKTRVLLNTHQQITGHFTRDPDLQFPVSQIDERITGAVGEAQIDKLNATFIATRLLGDSIASNLFMLGYAYQQGLIPVSSVAIDKAIEINGVAIEMNKSAFVWGRRAARDLQAVEELATSGRATGSQTKAEKIDSVADLVDYFEDELRGYQSKSYAKRYRKAVDRIATKEAEVAPGSDTLTKSVARYLFKLMAYKDEYEVARLYTDGRFEAKLAERFEGDYAVRFHLAPPLLAKRDPSTGQLTKRTYGAWMLNAMRILATGRKLRGTLLDVFGYTAERRAERELLANYQQMLNKLGDELTADKLTLAIELAVVPEDIRGYGHVKDESLKGAETRRAELLDRWDAPGVELRRAA